MRYSPPWKPHPEQQNLGDGLPSEVEDLLRGARAGKADISGVEVLGVLENLFEAADLDGSKTLDKYELAEVMREYYRLTGIGRSRIKVVQEVEAAFERYDHDASGSLDFKEFCMMFSETAAEQTVFKVKLPAGVLQDVRRLATRMAGDKY